jgi:very-short-patch-repair endonuclease
MKGLKDAKRERLKVFRKELRRNLTPAEEKLWSYLRNKQLDGRRFRRQHSKRKYILDFYCHSEKLVIELDGESHNNPRARDYDHRRDIFLHHLGIKVLRFENKIVFQNPTWLLEQIRAEFIPTAPTGHLPLE